MALSVLILTGQSGSGKSTAIHALEDQGYFCVDNLPVALATSLLETIRAATDRVALVMDVREGSFLQIAPAAVAQLRQGPDTVRVIYLEAREDALLRRYSATRRQHPLDRGDGLRESIHRERELLAPLRELADDTLDTSAMSPHELRAKVIKHVVGTSMGDDLAVALVSFGFKYGLPLDADMVLDVRFLPNPYFTPSLRDRTGLDADVRNFVLGSADGRELVERTTDYLRFLVPHYQREGKRYLTVAVGCTGGQHRSVSVVHELARRLTADGSKVDVVHRDVGARP